MSGIINFLKNNYILIAILLLSSVLRFFHIDYQSVWIDEIHTLNESDPGISFSQMFDYLYAADPHPPLYFIAVKVIFSLFGYNTFVLRMFSAVIGIMGVWAMYLLGKEMYGKKAGLYAAAILAVNYFHIYYSQDARPYPLLFLSTTISFYFLVKFIKAPSFKTSALYGFFVAFMLYSHFFSLFALFSQYVILLYFVWRPYRDYTTSKKFFIYSLMSGIISLILYIPCLGFLMAAAERKAMWIAKPKWNVYSELFKEFFGYSEIVIWFVLILIIFFFIEFIKKKEESSPKRLFSEFNLNAFILLLWIFITLFIPLVKSYISIPMIVNRYFINVLPAVILMVVIGLMQIKNHVLRACFFFAIILFSLTNLIIVKHYYTKKAKTEFREATNFIKENSKQNANVVSSLGWYMNFFFKEVKDKNKIIDRSLDVYAQEMKTGISKIEPFWYIDGHTRPYTPTEETKQFIEDNFYLENNYDGYDVWTRYYIPKKNVPGIDITKYGELKQSKGDTIVSYIDVFENTGKTIKISGWAYFPDQDASASKINLLLIKGNTIEKLPTVRVIRKDVSGYMGLKYNTDDSGFSSEYNISNLMPGEYKIGIYIVNKTTKKEGLLITDKTVVKQ